MDTVKQRDGSASATPYSAGATRQLTLKAAEVLSTAAEQCPLTQLLHELGEQSDQLADHEREQLRLITDLMAGDPQNLEQIGQFRQAGKFEAVTSEDRMFITLTVLPPVAGGDPVEASDILRWLKEQNITRGVDVQTIKRATYQAAQGEDVDDVVIVRGKEPTAGQPASYARYARKASNGALELIDDRALTRQENMPLFCLEGDRILKVVPPTAGEAGYTADGHLIAPPAVHSTTMVVGKNIHQDEANNCYAQVNGVVVFMPEKVDVLKALILNQDVTRACDPIDFDGEVHVRGAVRSGARLQATGRIIVEGVVEGADIHSKEDDVLLRSGVAGRQLANIRAGRDIIARFAENAKLFAARDIVMEVGSLHSDLTAGRAVIGTDGKGSIAGGMIMAGELVETRQLGARGGTKTHVTVGVSSEILPQLNSIDQQSTVLQAHLTACDELIQQMERAVGDPRKLTEAELQAYIQLRQMKLGCEYKLRKLQEQRMELLDTSEKHSHGRIRALVNVHANVTVHLAGRKLELNEMRGPCTVRFDERTASPVIDRR